MKVLLIISRIIVGLLFLFSGFVKAVDPLGFSYKLDEYFVVFGMPSFSALSLPLSMLICAAEILLGFAVLLGTQLKKLSWVLLAMILFFTWLTGFTAITGKVTDCGCFGEVLTLTPWESFAKDVVLLFFIVIIFINRHTIEPLFHNRAAEFTTWGSGVLTLLLSLHCFYYLPVIDFRPYAIGNNLPKLMNDGVPAEYNTKLVYKNKNTGKTKTFTTEEISDLDEEKWEWQETKNIKVKEGKPNTIQDLVITDSEDNDVTEMLVTSPQPLVLVIAYDLDNTTESAFKRIQQIKQKCSDKDIKFVGLTSSSYEKTDLFRQSHNIDFKFYFADATTLKTIIRSNPGLLLLRGGTVLDKWPNTALPTCNDLKQNIKNADDQ